MIFLLRIVFSPQAVRLLNSLAILLLFNTGHSPVALLTKYAAPLCNLTLFPDEEPASYDRNKKIMIVMDSINQRYGSGSVHLAAENSAFFSLSTTSMAAK